MSKVEDAIDPFNLTGVMTRFYHSLYVGTITSSMVEEPPVIGSERWVIVRGGR